MRAFRVAYDGTGYRGYQRQPHGDTVENALFRALAALDVTAVPEEPPPGYSASGRTDAGVSALRQTVALEAPDWLSPSALNGELPEDVRAWASADVPGGFHAQHDARRRTYEYHLHAPNADEARARDTCDRLTGDHDLHNLTPGDEETERVVDAAVERDGDYLVCEFTAGGFPREFCRRAVGLLAAVAAGDRGPAFVDRALSDESLQGPDGIAPAPPEPLFLRAVAFDRRFEVDKAAAAAARAAFESRRVERTTGARVAARLGDGVTD